MRHSSRLPTPKSPSSSSKRSPSLHLPGLPRFHPANYPTGSSGLSPSSSSASKTSSTANSPPSNLNSPQVPGMGSAPVRPQYHARQYSDAQRQLYSYQRELMLLNQYSGSSPRPSQPSSPSGNGKRSSPLSPRSPRLHPLGSPGPVTPLELEGHQQVRDGYLFAGSGINTNQLSEEAKDQIVETFIQREAAEAARSNLSPHMQANHARAYHAAAALGMSRGDHTSHRSALSR